MQRFWDTLISPLLDALRPRVIVEIGAESGAVTMKLLEWAVTREALVHSVDPLPAFDPDGVEPEFTARFRFHRARSLEVLAEIGAVDLALIDGDHNWYTVVNELRTLEHSALDVDRPPPVVLLHDVGWPYARRDLYYEPSSIPKKHRHRYAREGIIPDQSALGEPGLNGHLRNAIVEGGAENGVLTAVEDFIAESSSPWTWLDIPGLHGLGVLMPGQLLDEHGRARDLFGATQSAGFLRHQCEVIERARVMTEIARSKLSRDLKEAHALLPEAIDDPERQLPAEPPPELATLRRALARTQASLREAEAERVELEAELEHTARQGRIARRQERELKAELGERDAELEARTADVALAQARLEAREQRLAKARSELAELETAHETLETGHEALQADHRQLKADREGLQAERDTLRGHIEALEAENGGLRAEIETLQAEGARLQGKIETLHADSERLQGEIEALHASGRLQGEIETLRADGERLEADRAESWARERDLRLELDEVRGAGEADAAELRQSFEAQADDLRAELHRLQRSDIQTRQELAQLGSELELAGAQRDRLHDALARARVDAEVADAERAAFEQQATELTALLERAANGYLPPPEPARPPAPVALGAVAGAPATSALAPHGHVDGGASPSLLLDESTLIDEDYVAEWPLLPASEFQAQAGFVAAYRAAVAIDPDGHWSQDAAELESPTDRRGVLTAAGEGQEADQPTVDIVVCVHDALDEVRTCLWSLVNKTDRRFRLIIVNDDSNPATSEFLRAFAEEQSAVTLVHRDQPPHGYTLAANAGMEVSGSDYVVLLNSDTIVTYGWLERIVAYGERHDRMGILGPLSNAAGHQSVPHRREAGEWATNPLPDWITEDGVALLTRHLAGDAEARLPFINGFCYVIKRAVIEAIGMFDDELFPTGYCEENDYSQRARDAGFELGVVDDAYVFHAKSRSYGSSRSLELRRRNYELFLDKHGRERINALVRSMEADETLGPMREAVGRALSSPALAAEALERAPLSIVFVLPGLAEGGSGGSHSIYQEVHGLRSLGIPARIALHATAWERASGVYADAPDIMETFADQDELASITADADAIVATHFKSVEMVSALQGQRDDFLAAYYVQDYEPFFSLADPADREEAVASYTALTHGLSFAKTHWLSNVIGERHGIFVAKVEPSIDERVFHPRGRDAGGDTLRVVAMIRPRTPRRQPFSTVSVLERLLADYGPAVAVTTFGCRIEDLRKLTRSTKILEGHAGMLGREQVADLFRRSDVFLDVSMYQAFGRTALEAMACACTAIVPRVGGAREFAVDGVNALVVDTLDRGAPFSALASLVSDRDRLADLQTNALATGAKYSIVRAALSEYVAIDHAYRARFGSR